MCYFSGMKQRIPAFLKPGDLIGLSATARYAEQEMLNIAKEFIEAAGFKVCYYDDILLRQGQVAGTTAQRINAFNKLIHHRDVKAIWNVRGGYGSAEIVDAVDWDALQKEPKWLIGFSDFTTFLCHAHQKGIPSVHAAMPVTFHKTDPTHMSQTFQLLQQGPKDFQLQEESGYFKGRLLGGNLSVIYSLYGTPSLPSLEGAVLLLEDLDEYHYHLDRMLLALKRKGAFNGVKGVFMGQFSDIHDHDTAWRLNVEETLVKYFQELGIPFLSNMPFGHTTEQYPLIIGSMIEVSGKKISFSL